jgi:hypothetical protein
VAFGDLYLQDVREYRERQLRGSGLAPLFPLWQMPTKELAQDMIRAGVRAKVTCVDPKKLDRTFVGREFDAAFLADLPAEIDACGENGEFHTFVYDSPVFAGSIPVAIGEVVERDGFVFADVIPWAEVQKSDPGLCGSCRNSRVMTSDRGSQFYRCMLSDVNSRFAKYPRLPMVQCEGWKPVCAENA